MYNYKFINFINSINSKMNEMIKEALETENVETKKQLLKSAREYITNNTPLDEKSAEVWTTLEAIEYYSQAEDIEKSLKEEGEISQRSEKMRPLLLKTLHLNPLVILDLSEWCEIALQINLEDLEMDQILDKLHKLLEREDKSDIFELSNFSELDIEAMLYIIITFVNFEDEKTETALSCLKKININNLNDIIKIYYYYVSSILYASLNNDAETLASAEKAIKIAEKYKMPATNRLYLFYYKKIALLNMEKYGKALNFFEQAIFPAQQYCLTEPDKQSFIRSLKHSIKNIELCKKYGETNFQTVMRKYSGSIIYCGDD